MNESLGTDTCYEERFFTISLTEQPQACLDRVTEALLKEETFELRHQ